MVAKIGLFLSLCSISYVLTGRNSHLVSVGGGGWGRRWFLPRLKEICDLGV